MKSAYELAMEKLNRTTGPTKKLSEEQKAQISEIDRKYDAKIAEVKMSCEDRLTAAQTQEDVDAAKADMAGRLRALEESREAEKEAVWNK